MIAPETRHPTGPPRSYPFLAKVSLHPLPPPAPLRCAPHASPWALWCPLPGQGQQSQGLDGRTASRVLTRGRQDPAKGYRDSDPSRLRKKERRFRKSVETE